MIRKVTSKFFYATGDYMEQMTEFEKKVKVHESKVLEMPTNFETELIPKQQK